MKMIELPNGKFVNLDQCTDVSVSGSDLIFTSATPVTYTASSNSQALALLEQVKFAAQSSVSQTTLTLTIITRSITSCTPNTTVRNAFDTLTIAGTNMIDQDMIDRGELLVQIQGLTCSVVTSTPSSIVVVAPLFAGADPTAQIDIIQSPYVGSPVVLCTDSSKLAIT